MVRPTAQCNVHYVHQRASLLKFVSAGVGKSTVAVNVAFGLSLAGFQVGLLDCDVYGPSLPTMVQPADRAVRVNAENAFEPVRPVVHRSINRLQSAPQYPA